MDEKFGIVQITCRYLNLFSINHSFESRENLENHIFHVCHIKMEQSLRLCTIEAVKYVVAPLPLNRHFSRPQIARMTKATENR